jgi:hypothetical protein
MERVFQEISFNRYDVGVIEVIAARRHIRALPRESPTTKSIYKDVVGVAGEYALLKYLGLDFRDWNALWDETDELPDVAEYEIRTSTLDFPKLKVGERRLQADRGKIWILAWTQNPLERVRFLGWKRSSSLIAGGALDDQNLRWVWAKDCEDMKDLPG